MRALGGCRLAARAGRRRRRHNEAGEWAWSEIVRFATKWHKENTNARPHTNAHKLDCAQFVLFCLSASGARDWVSVENQVRGKKLGAREPPRLEFGARQEGEEELQWSGVE